MEVIYSSAWGFFRYIFGFVVTDVVLFSSFGMFICRFMGFLSSFLNI